MRNVKVYVISETTRAVAGNFVEFYESPRHGVPDAHIYTREESGRSERDEEVALASYAPFRIPANVHRYRDVDGNETFFALHPRVAELLATPASLDVVARARSDADEVVRRVRESEDRALARYSCECISRESLQARVSEWQSLPWFVRVWRALRREV